MSIHSDDGDSGGILGESAYEILSESTIMTDDDDDGGSSVASFDEHSDDEFSLADSESISNQPHDPHPIPSFGGLDEHRQLDDSNMTLRARDAPSRAEIVFEEPKEVFSEQISVCHNLAYFTEDETAEMCRHLRFDDGPPSSLFSTVRLTMTAAGSLVIDGPLRVLYVGSMTAQDEILGKLGSALVAGSSSGTCSSSWGSVNKSTTFSVVPISGFGSPSTSPDVELLDTSGPKIAIDRCITAKATKRGGQPDDITLFLDNDRTISSSFGENGVQLESKEWKLPHLAVVYCADGDDVQTRMTRVYARSFMARHSVPTLVISHNQLYQKPTETYALDSRSVHVCIESDTSEKGPMVHKRLPVDLSTFLKLNPQQLNRNLAVVTCLTPSKAGIPPAPVGRSKNAKTSLQRDVEKEPKVSGDDLSKSWQWPRNTKREELWKIFLAGWLLVCGLAAGTFTLASLKHSRAPAMEPKVHPIASISAIPTTPTPKTQSSVTLISSLSSSSSAASLSTRSSLASVSPYIPKESHFEKKLATNDSDRFQVHLWEKNIMIRPPHKFFLLRRLPKLAVDVNRYGQSISSELSELFDGVYTLKLNAEDRWGQVNVSIRTTTRPIITETLEVDLGSSWLQIPMWFTHYAGINSEELQKGLSQKIDTARELAGTASQQAAEMKDVAVRRAKAYSDDLSSGVMGFYERSRGVLRSETIRIAQQQAKKVWLTYKERSSEPSEK